MKVATTLVVFASTSLFLHRSQVFLVVWNRFEGLGQPINYWRWESGGEDWIQACSQCTRSKGGTWSWSCPWPWPKLVLLLSLLCGQVDQVVPAHQVDDMGWSSSIRSSTSSRSYRWMLRRHWSFLRRSPLFLHRGQVFLILGASRFKNSFFKTRCKNRLKSSFKTLAWAIPLKKYVFNLVHKFVSKRVWNVG